MGTATLKIERVEAGAIVLKVVGGDFHNYDITLSSRDLIAFLLIIKEVGKFSITLDDDKMKAIGDRSIGKWVKI